MRPFIRRLRRFPSPLPLLFIIGATVAVILWGRGYRPDFKGNTLKSTGLLSATSDPIGAQVYIEGKLKTATNNPINLDPGWYTVKIAQEGYIPWEKKLRLQGEVVTRTDAFLFPTSPSLSPLTNTGILSPLLSPDGTKIAYVIPQRNDGITSKKAGLWVYELAEKTLGFNRDPRQLQIYDPAFNFSQSTFSWSPDSTQLMVSNGKSIRLYNVARVGDFADITFSANSIKRDWDDTKQLKLKQQLAAFKQPIIDIATSSARVIALSPDETKILYEATGTATIAQVLIPPLIGTNPTEEARSIEPGKIYVYDSKEDRNYFLLDKNELIQTKGSPTPSPKTKKSTTSSTPELSILSSELSIYWFPTNRHLVMGLAGKIDIIEYDRTNWVTVYSGPFKDGFIAPYPSGSRIIILTNLNPDASTLPNLYTVNLR